MAGWSRRGLWILLLAAALLRLWRIAAGAAVLEGDGCEYARLAENLRAGHGYRGMLAGPEIMLPPLFPVLIAGLSGGLGLDADRTGRLLSCAASLGLVVAAGLLHARAARADAARASMLLFALSPGLVLAGSAVFPEALQMLLLALGLHATLGAVRRGGLLRGLEAGAWFGAAYLARVESLAMAVPAILAILIGPWLAGVSTSRADRAKSAAGLLLGCALLALPYAVHLRAATGDWRLEGKSERVAATVALAMQGLPYRERNYGLDEDGEPIGPWLQPNLPPAPETSLLRVAWADPWGFLRHCARNLASLLVGLGAGYAFSSVLVLAAAALGIRWLWRLGPAGRPAAFLLGSTVLLALGLGCVYKAVLRYGVMAVLGLYPLAAVGLVEAGRRLALRTRRPAALLIGILLAVTLASLGVGFLKEEPREYYEAAARNRPLRDLGERLRTLVHRDGPIMSRDPRIAYYAGRIWTPTPAAPTERALWAEIDRRGAAILVIEDRDQGPGPWFRVEAPPWGLHPVLQSGPISVFEVRGG
jgi:4-amino-4-deoxy-L-arabinose transferase-like glycosyltransferase